MSKPRLHQALLALITLALASALSGASFDIPAQPAPAALKLFIKQSGSEVVYLLDDLKSVTTKAVQGDLSPSDALGRLLAGTGFTAQPTGSGNFAISRINNRPGSIEGSIRVENGRGVEGARVLLAGSDRFVLTDKRGRFTLEEVPPGDHSLQIFADGMQKTHVTDITVRSGYRHTLSAIALPVVKEGVNEMEAYVVSAKKNEGVVELDPYEVEGNRVNVAAGGNIDLPRTETDSIAFTVFDREEFARSGAVNIENFLTRNLLQHDPSNISLIANASARNGPSSLSSGFNLRQLGTDETVILLNGRRLPDTPSNNGIQSRRDPPDLRAIPLSMVERIEVLPSSGSAIYGEGATGGVINIVLRRDVQATELTTIYDNAFGYDAPRLSATLVHGMNLLGGKLQTLLTASWRRQTPPTEAELGYFAEAWQRQLDRQPFDPVSDVFAFLGSTPNVNQIPVGGISGFTNSFASVPKGYDGSGGPSGIATALKSRDGVLNLELFPGPIYVGSGYEYGSESTEEAIKGTFLFRPRPELELSLDVSWASNRIGWNNHVAYQGIVLASSPFNPFGTDLNAYFWDPHGEERLGNDWLKTDQYSLGLGMLLKLPGEWQLTVDAAGMRNKRVRHNVGYNQQELMMQITEGAYNPFRDAVSFPAPAEVYAKFVHAADAELNYSQEQGFLRLFHDNLSWWAGQAQFVGGGEWQRDDSEDFAYDFQGIDFTGAVSGRGFTQTGYAGFAELRTELLPARTLPKWLRRVEGDFSLRQAWKNTSAQESWSRHAGLKFSGPGGLALRASFGSAFKPPTYQQSFRDPTRNPSQPTITDPRRGNERYRAPMLTTGNSDLNPEDGKSYTIGLVFDQGRKHRFRATVDWTRTEKVNEIVGVNASFLLANESVYSDRIQRQTPQVGDSWPVGRVTFIEASPVNLLGSNLDSWETALRYQWTECLGGMLTLSGRGSYLQSHETQLSATAPAIQNVDNPGAAFFLTKYRATWSAGWNRGDMGFGLDGLYNHSALIPSFNYVLQGSDRVDRYWQWDVWLQGNLSRLLPRAGPSVRGQVRINNIFGSELPLDVSDTLQRRQFGDWRKRTYVISLTTSF